MKNNVYKILLIAGITLLSFIGTGAANAAGVDPMNKDYTGSDVDMHKVKIGQYGTVSDSAAYGNTVVGSIHAFLPSNSEITFTYNFNGDLLAGLLVAGGTYSYKDKKDYYEGYAAGLSDGPMSFSGGTTNGTTSAALAFATASMDVSDDSASATITNLSGDWLDVTSLIVGYLSGITDYTVSYEVSSVPLPAALPMFGMGLIAVAGLRSRRKRNS